MSRKTLDNEKPTCNINENPIQKIRTMIDEKSVTELDQRLTYAHALL